MRPSLLLLVPLFGLLVAGCPTPTQYGGPIAVDTDGFAARMAWLCRWGVHDGQDQACFDPHAKEKESAGRDRPDAGPPVKTRPAEERPKADTTLRHEEKPALADAGAPKDKETDAAAASPVPPSAEAGAEPKPPARDDDTPGPEEPPQPPDSPGEESTGRT